MPGGIGILAHLSACRRRTRHEERTASSVTMSDRRRSAVKLLVIPASYPHRAAEWLGAQNEHSVLALRNIAEHVEVLSPRPFAPRIVAFTSRWRGYAGIPRHDVRSDVRVHRPAYPVMPKVLRGFWQGPAAFVFCRSTAAALHREIRFDAILSFDLASTGGLAWRLGRALGIPACGWATGSDVRWDPRSRVGRNLRRTLSELDLVFYQTPELKTLAAALLGRQPEALPPGRHIVRPRGVMEPDGRPATATRFALRSRLQVSDDDVLVLYVGRIVRGKGLFELVESFPRWASRRTGLSLVMVGAIPGYDDAGELQKRIRSVPGLNGHVRILPACPPRQLWEYFSAADIFVFPSFKEGMPNSLLEAMLGGLPAVAFAIPAIREIARFGTGLIEVPPYDFETFGESVLKLASDASLRREIAECGRNIVREQFSIHKSMRGVVADIRSVIGR